jgi:peptidoglycan L-alanyl-D-glutamate endopeptidase CwlK
MAFSFGAGSKKKLEALEPNLKRVCERAIQLSTVDFTVYETIRTPERQAELVAQGFSQTLHSKHLAQSDGLSHAADLVPWNNGAPDWKDSAGFRAIAAAMFRAAIDLGVQVRYGGFWKTFIDSPHWER